MIDLLINRTIELKERSLNKVEERKYDVILELLKIKDCFLKIDIKYAYSVLEDLGYKKEEIPGMYLLLIKPKKDN